MVSGVKGRLSKSNRMSFSRFNFFLVLLLPSWLLLLVVVDIFLLKKNKVDDVHCGFILDGFIFMDSSCYDCVDVIIIQMDEQAFMNPMFAD